MELARPSRQDVGDAHPVAHVAADDLPSDLRLVALAAALGAAAVGGPLSSPEARLLTEAARFPIAPEEARRVRSLIRDGGDPLGALFYGLRSAAVRRQSGAVYTPRELVEPMIAWTLERKPDRVVDAGAGSGRFTAAIARQSPTTQIVAVDLDPVATLMTRAALASLDHQKAIVVQGDFTTARLGRIEGRTAYLGNPPYVRHHDLDQRTKAWAQAAAKLLGRTISGLAGLHALFYLATAHHGRDGDVGCFVTSAEWLDVNYGRVVRELLLENLGGEALYVIEPESMPFGDTATTAAIACFELGAVPARLRLRGVKRVAELPSLTGGQEIARERLAAAPRWSHFIRTSKPTPSDHVELGELCRVHRGAVTGSNATWVRRRGDVVLPEAVLFPSITKGRELFAAGDRLMTLDGLRLVIDLPEDLDELAADDRRRVEAFLREAKRAGAADGYVASTRKAWWRVGLRRPAPILASYMARRAPAFVRNDAEAHHINIAHGIYPREPMSPLALDRLAQALRSTVVTASGRTYAGGLTKFEPREMERLAVPDLATLNA